MNRLGVFLTGAIMLALLLTPLFFIVHGAMQMEVYP